MTTAYQLPDDVGQKSIVIDGTEVQAEGDFPVGQKSKNESIPVVLPRDGNIPIVDNYRIITEVDNDLLGFPRVTTPYSFISKTDTFELSANDWIYDVTGIDERPQIDGTESARWTQLQNATAIYSPAPNAEVKYDDPQQAAQLILNSNDGGFQRARISSRRRYRYQPGRIVRASLAVRMSVEDTPVSVTRLWGIGDPKDGFFVQVKGDGVGDRLSILYRNSAGNGLKSEVEIPRSQWSYDPMDGTGPSKQTLDLTNTFMVLIEWGWYGASDVKFYFFVVDKDENLPSSIVSIPRARWVLAHEIILADTRLRSDLVEDDGVGGQRPYDVPSLKTPSLPIWCEINNSGNLARSEFIERYGASIIVDGGSDERANIRYVDATTSKSVPPIQGGEGAEVGTSLITIRSRDYITNSHGEIVPNTLVTRPLVLNVATTGLIELEIWKDPTMVPPTDVGHINGDLPYKPGDYFNPINLIPLIFTSFDEDGNEIAFEQEDPQTYLLSIDTAYANGDPDSIDISFNDYRVVSGGQRIGSYIIDTQGESLDLTEIFNNQRELISTEFDTPPEFQIKTKAIKVKEFDTSTGIITVRDAFPLRLFPDQRLTYAGVDYYVLSLISATTFTVKAAKVDTTPVMSGFEPGELFVAYYELGITNSVADTLKPIYQTEVVFLAKPFGATYIKYSPDQQYDAEWMQLVNCTTDNTYAVQSTPNVDLYLTNGVS